MSNNETIIPTVCALHCGGNCLLKAHVRDGVITRLETDNGDEPQLRACMRGRSLRKMVYHPDRILYPLKRVGKRGEGKFKRIAWDEALGEVASELKRVRDTFSPMSILYLSQAGDLVCMNSNVIGRVLHMAGGCTRRWGASSFHGGMFASFFSYGTVYASNSREDLLNSKLIVMWGWDPATSISGTNTTWILKQAKENGARIISVDPWYNDAAVVLADEWVPVRPGTDAAALVAMAYVMIAEDLYNKDFVNRFTEGFDKYRDYVLGKEDGIPKTPAWAEDISGIPAATLERLAREYASVKPAAFMAGTGPGRTAVGEQYHRAAIVLAAMTGNVGIHGGDPAARAWESVIGGYPYPIDLGSYLPGVPNPVEKPGPYAKWRHYTYPRVHYTKVADAILTGKSGGFPADYKMALLDTTNYLNSQQNVNKIVKALDKLEFIVTLEQFMNPTAKYADIILPTTTYMERNDIAPAAGTVYYGFQNKIVEPLGECKPQWQIARELAARLGIANYDEKSEEDHLKGLASRAGIADLDGFRKAGVHRIAMPEPYLAFKKQVEDPQKNPFPTPSGKIEIYSQQLADMNNPQIPPIPKYIETWESRNDPLAGKYPIQLLTNHAKQRALAKLDNIRWLKELVPQALVMNADDAAARNIRDGETVRVYNDRGEVRTPAHVTNRVMRGVAILPNGAWYDPDEKGIDRAGSANVLTNDVPSPGGAYGFNTILVQVEKTQGDLRNPES